MYINVKARIILIKSNAKKLNNLQFTSILRRLRAKFIYSVHTVCTAYVPVQQGTVVVQLHRLVKLRWSAWSIDLARVLDVSDDLVDFLHIYNKSMKILNTVLFPKSMFAVHYNPVNWYIILFSYECQCIDEIIFILQESCKESCFNAMV